MISVKKCTLGRYPHRDDEAGNEMHGLKKVMCADQEYYGS